MMETVPSVLMAFLNTPMKKVRDEEARQERGGGAGGLSDGGVFQATHVGIRRPGTTAVVGKLHAHTSCLLMVVLMSQAEPKNETPSFCIFSLRRI